jgi:hypothetical protein
MPAFDELEKLGILLLANFPLYRLEFLQMLSGKIPPFFTDQYRCYSYQNTFRA